jgi:aminoglycoside phosphotransferase family enzyme/gluconate kinase
MDTDATMQQAQRLVEALSRADAYPHPTRAIHVVETHCAWVLLTGEFAYKIKKPVDFGFLNFSTLEKRRFYCEEEVRLNRRFAPDIYLDVVAVTGQPHRPRMAGSGSVLEYAVRMRQFADDGLLSQLADRKCLDVSHIDQMIDQVTGFHQSTQRASADAPYGEPERIHHWVSENFQHIRPSLKTPRRIKQLAGIQDRLEAERKRIDAILRGRKKDGFIRECHGDLHLGNITLIDGKVTLFDCIEFNPELRWIDVFSDVAFLVMDLDDRRYRNFAFRFLNAYLQHGGDYQGLGVLRYYMVYRALVRAKVAILRRQQAAPDSETFQAADAEYSQYIQLAESYLAPGQPTLLITCGLSGSGKSTVASQFCEASGMIQIRSDIERKRMSGLEARDKSRSGLDEGLYSAGQTEKTYQRLAEQATLVLKAGYSVIVDATFLQRKYRDVFRSLAEKYQVPFTIVHCVATDKELEQRIQARELEGGDPSEATLDVLNAQRKNQEPLGAEEQAHVMRLDSEAINDPTATWRRGI